MQVFYDHEPSVLEPVGNGSYLYHWNIQVNESEDKVLQWQCQEVTVWPPLTANKITEVVINELWAPNYEQKLINEFNSAYLGLYTEDILEEKIEAYKQFLLNRQAIKDQIDNDCKMFEIK